MAHADYFFDMKEEEDYSIVLTQNIVI
jgi:hypothetical protein